MKNMSFIVPMIVFVITSTTSSALTAQNPKKERKCVIPVPRVDPPPEIGRCLCMEYATEWQGRLSSFYCKCTAVYFHPSTPGIPQEDCIVSSECTNENGPCQTKRKYTDNHDPSDRQIPNWTGSVMPTYGVYSNIDIFGGG